MHGTEIMAAVHSAPHLPQPMQVHNFPSTILKKNYEPYVRAVDNHYVNDFEDDDDFSDHDSHYSEDLQDDLDRVEVVQKIPNITQQLLDFTEMVNADIKKFFGRNKNEEDSCDIYEDKWMPTKSGRELYYADLLRVAQGDVDVSKTKEVVSPISPKTDPDNRHRFSGKLDAKIGLGPLNELFDLGLRPSIIEKDNKFKRLKRVRLDDQKQTDVVPMHDRTFPDSFWKEPGSERPTDNHKTETTTPGILNSSKPPDFSDLLQSWTGGHSNFPEEMSSEGSMDSSAPADIQHL